ncbi:alpha/beta hydrolase [Clostridiaceae bacterium HSG29]|nr:alpha/beta hydrolase [Clostridiaceae bacterium HSG29]
MKKRIKKLSIVLIVVIVLLYLGLVIYSRDYYRASDYVDEYITSSNLRIEINNDHTYIYPSVETSVGIIFYPGGKVEAKAYMPLLMKLAEQGYFVTLVEMPFNLAVLDINVARDVIEEKTDISDWYLAGHSLGGAMASSFLEKNYELIEGLILMGAYPINDAPVEDIVIYGTNDIMLNMEKVKDSDQIFEIVDGNHAWFGDYGEQNGDGQSLISHDEQQRQTVEKIVDFINN